MSSKFSSNVITGSMRCSRSFREVADRVTDGFAGLLGRVADLLAGLPDRFAGFTGGGVDPFSGLLSGLFDFLLRRRLRRVADEPEDREGRPRREPAPLVQDRRRLLRVRDGSGLDLGARVLRELVVAR